MDKKSKSVITTILICLLSTGFFCVISTIILEHLFVMNMFQYIKEENLSILITVMAVVAVLCVISAIALAVKMLVSKLYKV